MDGLTIYRPDFYPKKSVDNGFASEDAFQCAAFMWAWNTYPKLRWTFLHPANEGYKNIVKAKQDEAKGMLPGAFDFIFMRPSFAIEIKQPGNWLTKNQEKFQAALRANNIPEFVCYFMDEFQFVVRQEVAKIGL